MKLFPNKKGKHNLLPILALVALAALGTRLERR